MFSEHNLKAIDDAYKQLSPDGGAPSPAFKNWLTTHHHDSTYHEFLKGCLSDQWGEFEDLCLATFVDVGTATVDTLEALVKGLRSGDVRVSEWVGVLNRTRGVGDPRQVAVEDGANVAALLVEKSLAEPVCVERSRVVAENECYRRSGRLMPFVVGGRPEWW